MDRFKATKIASIFGIIGNIFLTILKGLFALISHSQSLLADTFNSAGDVLSSLMTYIGNKISSKEADNDHNLGHGKAEYIYSMLISIVMFVLSFTTIKSSIISLVKKQTINYSNSLIVVCLVTILTKLILFIFTNILYKKTNNILIKANSLDHRNDILITTLTFISILLSANNIKYIDGIVGIVISTWIAYSASKIFIESYNILMDKSIDEKTKSEVLATIKKHSEIDHIQHFNATPVGYRYQISFTIFVDGNLSTYKSHEIANNLEKEIINNFPEIYLTVIHVNPIENDKKNIKEK